MKKVYTLAGATYRLAGNAHEAFVIGSGTTHGRHPWVEVADDLETVCDIARDEILLWDDAVSVIAERWNDARLGMIAAGEEVLTFGHDRVHRETLEALRLAALSERSHGDTTTIGDIYVEIVSQIISAAAPAEMLAVRHEDGQGFVIPLPVLLDRIEPGDTWVRLAPSTQIPVDRLIDLLCETRTLFPC
jgi:hypothetical protein